MTTIEYRIIHDKLAHIYTAKGKFSYVELFVRFALPTFIVLSLKLAFQSLPLEVLVGLLFIIFYIRLRDIIIAESFVILTGIGVQVSKTKWSGSKVTNLIPVTYFCSKIQIF